jgi:pyruvate/2-oxoglutarate dehydrogenase complex dihydrolipoamide acyltransferase (E2) component
MQARVQELLPPLQQLVHARQTEAYRLQQTQHKKEEEAKKQAAEETKEQVAKDKKIDVNGVLGVHQDGNITDHVCPEADAASKSKVCQQMNMAGKKKDADLEHSMFLAAATILRNRLIVVESVATAKLYMESSTKSGYKCRTAYTDFTQHRSLISRAYTQRSCVLNPLSVSSRSTETRSMRCQ